MLMPLARRTLGELFFSNCLWEIISKGESCCMLQWESKVGGLFIQRSFSGKRMGWKASSQNVNNSSCGDFLFVSCFFFFAKFS